MQALKNVPRRKFDSVLQGLAYFYHCLDRKDLEVVQNTTAGGRPPSQKKDVPWDSGKSRTYFAKSISMHDKCVYGASGRTTIPCKKRMFFFILLLSFPMLDMSRKKATFD